MLVMDSRTRLNISKFLVFDFSMYKADFEDSRHLVRLWLRDPELAWETPEALKCRWEMVYGGVTAENQVFPLEPSIRSQSAGTGNSVASNGATTAY